MRRIFIAQHRQGGAIAIMFALSLVVLFACMGIALDLGRLYVVRTELQNAADAAALAGAKDLDQTLAGVNKAVTTAKAIAGQNRTTFSFNGNTGLTIPADNILVGSCPTDACMVKASDVKTNVDAADKPFLKVTIPSSSLTAYFMRMVPVLPADPPRIGAPTNTNTTTFGMAVAGRYLTDITPMAICKLDNTTEFGYERGVSYNIADANPIGPGTSYWIDPVATGPGACSGGASASLPYLCAGKITFTPVVGQPVYTNTGVSDPQLEALDSRFGVFNSKNKCDAISAPPDTNIKEYSYGDVAAGSPRDWMSPAPTQQSLSFGIYGGIYGPKPLASRTFQDYGVLWSASRPVGKTVSDWPSLYAAGAATAYPEPSPYQQTTNPFFVPPPAGTAGKAGRRVLHMPIVDCPTAGGSCRPATVRGIGKFIMQRKANTPSDKNVYVEFAGLIDPIPTADIKLYR